MKFKSKIKDLKAALDAVSLIHPVPVDSEGSAGYLAIVQGAECSLYSRDEHQKCKVKFPIFEVEGEGAFVIPVSKSYSTLGEGWISFETKEKDGTFSYVCQTQEGEHMDTPSFDPKNLSTLDKDFKSATKGPSFPSALLKEAVSQARPYVAEANANVEKEYYKVMQIFDQDKGNGHLYATDGKRGFYFLCPEFESKGMHLHIARVGLLNSFLSKSSGDVTLYQSTNSTYLENTEGQVIGWSDQIATHTFFYYQRAKDQFVLHIPKDILVRVLTTCRSNLLKNEVKVHLDYDHTAKTLTVQCNNRSGGYRSMPIVANPLSKEDGTEDRPIVGGELGKTESLSFNASVDHLLELIAPVKGHKVELRIRPEGASCVLRIIEEIVLDEAGKVVVAPKEGEKSYSCRVTRVASSMR